MKLSIFIAIGPTSRRAARSSASTQRRSSTSSVVYLLRGAEAEGFGLSRIPVVVVPAGADSKRPSGLRSSDCTSNEGIHYSVWATRDAEQVRVWSAYQHLPYTVEPSGSKAEVADQVQDKWVFSRPGEFHRGINFGRLLASISTDSAVCGAVLPSRSSAIRWTERS